MQQEKQAIVSTNKTSTKNFSSKFAKSKSNRKTAGRGIYIAEEELIYNCECEGCSFSTTIYCDFLKHLEDHVTEESDSNDTGSCFNCEWENCEYIADNLNFLKVHVTYHGYHTKLKAIGSKLLMSASLPDCQEKENNIPILPEYYTCEWESCDIISFNYQFFLDHVKCHINGLPRKDVKKEDIIRCRWNGCSNTYPMQFKLLDHIRSHTKEKLVACPSCGVMFSSRTKFFDHRKRQLSTDLQGYQCSQCSKLFASERLLRDHMRIHINHYKCHLCDMTCAKPSTLAKHIRYRHLPERLFKCDVCPHSTITKQDLMRHKDTHRKEKQRECSVCGYKCRSKYIMERHVKKQHEGTWGLKYACHCCDKRFAMGSLLTKHLIKVHDFHWPSGHSRFSYKQDSKTGLFHLQVVRYESLEVTQEMMEDQISYPIESTEDCKFECIQNKPGSFVLKVSNIKHNIKCSSGSNVDVESKSASKTKSNVKNDKVTAKDDKKIIKVETIKND